MDCLADYIHAHKEDDDISNACKKAVRARQIVADKDIRLNPKLTKACKEDIPQLVH